MKFNYHCILLSDLPGLFLYCCLYLCLCLLSAWNKGVFIRVGHCFLVLIHIKALVVNIDHNFFGFLITHTHTHTPTGVQLVSFLKFVSSLLR